MVTLFNDGLKLVGIFWFLALMNVRLALVMAVFVPLALVTTLVFSRFAREHFRAIRSQMAKINSFLAESLAGVAVIQSFGGQERSSRTYSDLTQEYLLRSFGQIRVFGAFMPLTELMSSAAIALIIWYGGGEVIRRQLTIGELVAFLSYMRLFFQPLRELSQKYSHRPVGHGLGGAYLSDPRHPFRHGSACPGAMRLRQRAHGRGNRVSGG